MTLSMKNKWLDKQNKVYIIYQIVDIQDELGFSKKNIENVLPEVLILESL